MGMADLGVKTLTKDKLELKEPDKYDVVFVNDDVTTVEFVIKVLKNIFHKTTEQAVALTTHIHEKGKGVVGTYLYEIAEQKGIETTVLARDEGYPLQVKVQRHG
jgi:ATP-dependent Clp protease adaptor protein ClpS|tara:strand:+ start:1202 stop:1513 length:312 start_codon:yes stop_codon:yes gene_type:complete